MKSTFVNPQYLAFHFPYKLDSAVIRNHNALSLSPLDAVRRLKAGDLRDNPVPPTDNDNAEDDGDFGDVVSPPLGD